MKVMKNFVEFLRGQGVAGFAVGFIMGGAVSKLVTTFINDILNPLLGLIIGKTQGLSSAYVTIGSAQVRWGSFVSNLIDFTAVAFVVYLIFKSLRLDRLDKKKE